MHVFLQEIKYLYHVKKWSGEEVAKTTGVSKTTVHRIAHKKMILMNKFNIVI